VPGQWANMCLKLNVQIKLEITQISLRPATTPSGVRASGEWRVAEWRVASACARKQQTANLKSLRFRSDRPPQFNVCAQAVFSAGGDEPLGGWSRAHQAPRAANLTKMGQKENRMGQKWPWVKNGWKKKRGDT
jgi:hypothetical protein